MKRWKADLDKQTIRMEPSLWNLDAFAKMKSESTT